LIFLYEKTQRVRAFNKEGNQQESSALNWTSLVMAIILHSVLNFEPHWILIIRPKNNAKERQNQFRHESPTGLHAVPH